MIGNAVRRLNHCSSTNDAAALWARDAAPHGAVVVADSQTAGRGRQGRSWHSPPGENLYFSCVLRPSLEPAKVPPITLCAGIAVCEVVNSLGVEASIKWPNDVWVGERKLAGVLTEMSTRTNQLESVIVGVGININTRTFPDELAATSLALESGRDHDRAEVLGSLLFSMDSWIERYCAEGVEGLRAVFNEHNFLGGREVRARVSGAIVCGTVISLGDDGGLVLEDREGVRHSVIAGEVELLDAQSTGSAT